MQRYRMQELVDLVVSKQSDDCHWIFEDILNECFHINIESQAKADK